MFSRASRRIISTHSNFPASRRIISTYSNFPASLLRLNAGVAFKLFDFESQALSKYHKHSDKVEIPKASLGGLWSDLLPLSDGATLMPNTFTMQEIIRTAVDNYVDDVENGMPVERPYIFTIPKGTPLPKALVLLRERTAQFSLQPSQPISRDVLNIVLDDFYSKYAEKQDADQWLDGHNFEDAVADDAEGKWMTR